MIHWQVKFQSKEAKMLYTVSIYDDRYQGDPIQLTPGDSPFETQEENDRDWFKPVRTQSGYLTIVDDGFDMAGNAFDWRDMLPTQAKDRPVVLTDSNGVERWRGYLQPQTFSGKLYEPTQERRFPVMCPLSVLASEELSASNIGVKTFAFVLDAILNKTGFTYTYLNFTGYSSLEWLMKKVDWLNFLEEGDNGNYSAKYDCLTLLEEICKFWGWTCRTFEDDLWFVAPDDDLAPDYVGIEQSDLYDYLDAGTIPQYQEGTWGSVSTDADIYASTDNNIELMLGIRKATVKADINRRDVITEIPYSEIEDMYRDNTVQTTHVADHYTFALHFYGEAADYVFEDLHIHLNNYSSSTYNGYAAFLVMDSYEGDIQYKHRYNWRTTLGIAGNLVGTAYESEYIALIESITPHSYDHGVIAISGDVNHGCTFICRLKVGGKWWNGNSWQTTKTTFNITAGKEDAPSSDDSGSIISNRNLNGIHGEYDGYGAAISTAMGGKVSFEIVGFIPNGDQLAVQISSLKIEFVRDKAYALLDDDRNENTYQSSTNKNFSDEVNIDTIFASDNKNAYGLGIIMDYGDHANAGPYCDRVEYEYAGGVDEERPEEHLLYRIIARGRYTKMIEHIQILSNLRSITPYTKCVTANFTGYPIAINRYWVDDVTEAYIAQL